MKQTKALERWLQRRVQVLIAQDCGFLFWMLLFHTSALAYNWRAAAVSVSARGDVGMQCVFVIIWWFLGLGEIFLAAVGLAYVPRRLRTCCKTVLLIVSGACCAADLFVLMTYHDVIDEAKLEVVLGTNPRTVWEFCQTYLLQPSVLLFLALLVAAVALVRRRLLPRVCAWFSCGASVLAVLLLASVASFIASLSISAAFGSREDTQRLAGNCHAVNRMVLDAAAAWRTVGDLAAAERGMAASREPVMENQSDIPFVVFVVGESADRNKMGVYGYGLDTTPRLAARQETDALFCFDDTIASATYTTIALRQIFTFAEKEDASAWYTHANLLDIVHDAGYHTAWISNQSPVNVFGNMDRIFSARTDHAAFTAVSGGSTGTVTRHLDEELLPLLDAALASAQAKNFFVVHLYGSHLAYYQRVPDTFRPLSAADETGADAHQRQVKAEYDNTIAYTDIILDEIFRRFEDRDAVVLYLSDHGEEVYDGRDFVGHSDERAGNRHMIEIPMIFWASPAFAAKRPELVAAMEAARHRPYRTDDVIHTVLDLMKICVPSYRPEKKRLVAAVRAGRAPLERTAVRARREE